MREFPGQFPGKKLYNLDLREEDFWYCEAEKKVINRQLDLAEMMRIAMHGSKEEFLVAIRTLRLGLKTYSMTARELKAPEPPKRRGKKRAKRIAKPAKAKTMIKKTKIRKKRNR